METGLVAWWNAFLGRACPRAVLTFANRHFAERIRLEIEKSRLWEPMPFWWDDVHPVWLDEALVDFFDSVEL